MSNKGAITPKRIQSRVITPTKMKNTGAVSQKKQSLKNSKSNRSRQGEIFEGFIDDMNYVFKRMVNQFQVVSLYAVGLVFVFLHSDGYDKGPMKDWINPSSDSPAVKMLIRKFDQVCALILFVPLYFGVPKNYRVLAMVLSFAWVLLIKDVTYFENFLASLFVFCIVTVRNYRSRLILILIAAFVYFNFYREVKVTISAPVSSSNSETSTTVKEI